MTSVVNNNNNDDENNTDTGFGRQQSERPSERNKITQVRKTDAKRYYRTVAFPITRRSVYPARACVCGFIAAAAAAAAVDGRHTQNRATDYMNVTATPAVRCGARARAFRRVYRCT